MAFKKSFFALTILLAAATAATATELQQVTADPNGNTWHLDTARMTRKGYVVYVWQLQNLAQADANGALSVSSQVEFDCRFRQSRTMWVNLHSERDEGGKTLSSGMVASPEWVPAAPGSVSDTLLDYACRRIMR